MPRCQLSFGNVTQIHRLYPGTGPDTNVLGGYLTESDTSGSYAAFAVPLN